MSRRPPGSTARTLPIIVSTMLLAGCLLDFSEFSTEGAEVDMVVGDMDPDLPGTNNGDMDVGFDVGPDLPDMPISEGEVGAECSTGDECGALECRGGYCTTDCGGQTTCPDDTVCVSFGAETICALPCSRGACGDSGRDDLTCAPVSSFTGPGTTACLPDADRDGTLNRVDNCEMPNPTQVDTDLDGLGDACDASVTCPQGHTDGVLDLGTVDFGASDPAAPQVAGAWFPVAGGLANQMVSDRLVVFDREGPNAMSATLPYAARGFAAVQIAPDEYLMSPGNRGSDGQFGRFVHVFRDGTVRLGAPFQPAVFDPTLARAADGTLWMHAYTTPPSAGMAAWQIFHYDDDAGRFVPARDGTDPMRMRWSATADPQGRLHFYSEADAGGLGRFVTVTPGFDVVDVAEADYSGAMSAIDPFLIPAPGGGFFLFDRSTGQAWAFDGTAVGPPVPELDVQVDVQEARWIVHANGLGFTVVGHDQDNADALRAISYAPECFADLPTDRDADGIPDVVDGCPDQDGGDEDLDGDWIGDPCDPDEDGDGLVVGAGENLPRDTDNDGEENSVDADDDADGIGDAEDPFPLDTDQDGLPNALDPDDDDDGFNDSEEDPALAVDPLQFPSSGRIAWVEGADVVVAPLHDTSNAETVMRSDEAENDAHLPRLLTDGRVLILDGMPGATSRFEVADPASAQAYSFDVVLWGVDPAPLQDGMLGRVFATHGTDGDPTATHVSEIQLGGPTFRSLVTVLTGVGAPDFDSNALTFAASPANCVACRAAYRLDLPNGIPGVVASDVSDPRQVRYNGGVTTLLGDSSDGQSTSAWFGAETDFREIRPPDATDVTAAVGFNDGSIVVAAEGPDGGELWFFNGLRQRWHHLRDLNETTSELDWSR